MAASHADLAKYISDVLGLAIRPKRWPGKNRLPIYLRQAYDFVEFEMLGRPCLAMFDSSSGTVSPPAIRKQLDHLREKFSGDVIYVRSQLASYLRKRLIEQRVQFVVPGNQLYLPSFGIDLREYFRQCRLAPKQLGPAAQLTFLFLLVNRDVPDRTVNGLAQALGCSKMTASRAFSELESAELGKADACGRFRSLFLVNDRKQAWEQAQSRLKSPVVKRLFVDAETGEQFRIRAGLSALAEVSSLAAGERRTFATKARDFAEHSSKAETIEATESDVEVEIWAYDPNLLAKDDVVDPFSLFLSMRDNEDERVQAALAEMMEAITW